jgi:hypothetical protein
MRRPPYHGLLGLLSLVVVLLPLPVSAQRASPCSAEKVDALSRNNHPGQKIRLDCSLTLPKGLQLFANIVFEGSKANGAVLDCNGNTIDVASGKSRMGRTAIIVRSVQREDGTWDAPQDVVVKNCVIKGFMRVYGLDENANGPNMKASSRHPDHTEFAQAAAPKRTTFENLTIIAPNGISLYVGPGSMWTKLVNSRLEGRSGGTAIYLDAESGRSTIKDNIFDVSTKSRELIAIDGSTRNKILGNTFYDPVNGGIFAYRNCGEGGVIRHQTPNFNIISDNSFVYSSRDIKKPAVWLNSRNGKQRYCFIDPRYNFGSSKNSMDLAKKNVVSMNRIVGGNLELIRNNDASNEIYDNFAE